MYPVLWSQSQVPRTLETMNYVPLAQNHDTLTLDNMYFHQRIDKEKSKITPTMFKN